MSHWTFTYNKCSSLDLNKWAKVYLSIQLTQNVGRGHNCRYGEPNTDSIYNPDDIILGKRSGNSKNTFNEEIDEEGRLSSNGVLEVAEDIVAYDAAYS